MSRAFVLLCTSSAILRMRVHADGLFIVHGWGTSFDLRSTSTLEAPSDQNKADYAEMAVLLLVFTITCTLREGLVLHYSQVIVS